MKLKVIASSSRGNCYLLSSAGGSILIEAGVRFETIKRKLDYDLTIIVGCLISHEHMDHAKSVPETMKHGIDCYMSKGTADALKLKHHRLHFVSSNKQFKLGNFLILPFQTEHDSAEPLGFMIYDTVTKEKLVFATDTYYLKYKFKDVNYYMIECNYDRAILEENIATGVINRAMRKRLLNSHFSIDSLVKYFKEIDLTNCRKIVLIHLSTNNSSEEFKERIQKETGIETEIAWNQEIDLELFPF